MSSLTRQQLEDWLKTITEVKGNVLDVGGSQLPILKRLSNAELDVKDYKILDLAEPHECKQKPDIICDLNSRFEFTGKRLIESESHFDVAFCLEVSEYWWHPVNALNNINYLLKNGGILYISFHFVYPVHNPYQQDYLRYTPIGAEKLLEMTNFEIVQVTPRTLETYIANIDGMRPSKDYNLHDWAGCLIKARKYDVPS